MNIECQSGLSDAEGGYVEFENLAEGLRIDAQAVDRCGHIPGYVHAHRYAGLSGPSRPAPTLFCPPGMISTKWAVVQFGLTALNGGSGLLWLIFNSPTDKDRDPDQAIQREKSYRSEIHEHARFDAR